IYDEIRVLSFPVQRHLAADAVADVALQRAFAAQCALHLLLLSAGDEDEFVEARVAPGFDEDGSFDDRDAIGMGRAEVGNRLVFAPNCRRVHQRIQAGQTLRVSEDARRQGAAVDGGVGGQNLATEFLYHGLVSLSAGRHHRMADFIRLNQQATAGGQRLANKRLSAGETARQPNFQHTPKRRSAEATVLTMSMAMVRGPTPPGTGVYAPAHSTTSMGSTSPTSRLPLRSKDASFSGELRKIRAARSRSSTRLLPTSMTVAPCLM